MALIAAATTAIPGGGSSGAGPQQHNCVCLPVCMTITEGRSPEQWQPRSAAALEVQHTTRPLLRAEADADGIP